MKLDELAFFNQQLALMLRDKIPLEGAMRQLSEGMAKGKLRDEIQQLEGDLGRGLPLREALDKRELPEFYKQMVAAGAASGDLPGMLTLISNHYARTHAISTRLQGLMVYPAIVIIVALLLSLVVATVFKELWNVAYMGIGLPSHATFPLASVWLSPVLLALAGVALASAVLVPKLRAWARWRLPAFKEASVTQLASSMQVMLESGATLPEALALAEKIEQGSPAAPALAAWKAQISRGEGRLDNWRDTSGVLPPLLLWLVKSSAENPSEGFKKAAELFRSRSAYRTELLMYGALPVSVLLLGHMVIWQAVPVLQVLIWFMNTLGDAGL